MTFLLAAETVITMPAPLSLTRQYLPAWNGVAHHDYCQWMRHGRATFRVVRRDGYPPAYLAYPSEQTDFVVWSDPDGTIHVQSHHKPDYHGSVCIGVQDQ